MRTRTLCKRTLVLPLILAALVVAGAAWAATPAAGDGEHAQRNFDQRVRYNRGFEVAPGEGQTRAVASLAAQIPELAATFDETTGATSGLYNRTGYLTGPNPGSDPLAIAKAYAAANAGLLGLTPGEVAAHEVTDNVFTKATGASHVYLRQLHAGLPVYNGQLHVNVNRDGRVISVNNAFLPGLAAAVNVGRPAIGAADALIEAAKHLDVALGGRPELLAPPSGQRMVTRLAARELSSEEIAAALVWVPVRRGEARLAWNFLVYLPGGEHVYDMTVDAVDGRVWTRIDWVASDSYRVYPRPVESPNHTTPLPPSDGRVLVSDPADSTASPLAWHDTGSTSYNIMRGNNVHAYDDRDNNNAPPASEPSCGASHVCDFSLNLTQSPVNYIPAAVANLFYWNNIIHDVQYQYGFDEPGGNFQFNTFGNGGSGGDDVRAEAQDGSGSNNANFFTPTDGSRPRMQMYVWTAPNPDKDGDLDNGIVIHEYGHGISTRQVGGPGNSSCLGNAQQPGEGWSDWFALSYTAEVGDQGTDPRGIGTYALDQPTSGAGIRTQRYSTDPAVNNHTYESIQGMAIPHGVGEVWAQGIWEVYWALVDQYGFDPDLYNAGGGAGNQRAMLYVNEGLKNTACSPTFTAARDGIIQAATDNYGGVDVCLLWEAFAAYGLGTDAVSGGSGSTNPTNGFAVPASCQCSPQAIADAGADRTICLGDSTTLGTPAQSGHSYSWSPGGQTTAQINVSPSTQTTYTLTATTSCGSDQDSVTVFIDDGTGGGLSDDFESGAAGWSTSGLWHLATNSSCAGSGNGYSSPVNAFYYGQDSSCTYDTGSANSGTLTSPSISGITSSSTLTFDYYRQVESYTGGSYDQTEVEIIHSGGTDVVFALDSGDASQAAWVSSGSISLAAYAGDSIQVRFVFDTVDGVSNGFDGWFIDDVVVSGESSCTPGNTPPTVTITAPADGTTVTEGDSVSFSGTATDAEDGPLTSSLSWSSSLDGVIGSGGSFSTSTLSVGSHTITASVTDSGGLPGSDSISLTVDPIGGGCTGCIDWSVTGTVSYSTQDASGNVTVEDGGDTILLLANTWRRTTQTFNVTPDTVLEFEFASANQGEIHGIGFDENDNISDATRVFQVHGTQNWTAANHDYDNYPGGGGFVSYQIPVGQYYTGSGMFLVLVNDKDAGTLNNDSRFRNVRVYEDVPVGCSVDDDFEGGAAGWVNGAGATCSTGDFVLGTPTLVTNGGVTTQVGGDHTTGSGNALFTAVNTSAGVDDVDGGECILESPVFAVSEASDLTVWYFHGQRDAGDDAGDHFVLEVSTNGGSSYSPVVNQGDVTSNAAWTQASTAIAAGSSVKLRIRVADATGGGDLVEGGLDDLRICPSN